MKKRGFTLIELLVVVSIISILASVVLASLNRARVRSRNVKRSSDIEQLRNAFNLGFNGNNYPNVAGATICISTACTGTWSGYPSNAAVDAFLAPYIQKSTDPLDGTRGESGYLYLNPFTGPNGAGAYLDWSVESSGSCGPGVVWQTPPQYTECVLKLD